MNTLLKRVSIEMVWCLVVLTGVFAFVNTHPIRPHDFWWHIAVGRQIAATGHIPTQDTFSFTAYGQPYPAYHMFWLVEQAMYHVYRWGGPELIILTQSLVLTAAYGLLVWIGWRLSGSGRAAALGGLFAAALGFQDWNVRPQAITFLIGAGYVFAIYALKKKPAWPWVLFFPLGMALWVNSHGTFPLGFVLLGVWLTDEVWQQIRQRYASNSQGRFGWSYLRYPLVALLLTLGAVFLNPSGLGIVGYLGTMSGSAVIQNLVPEWAPPSFNSIEGSLFFVGLLAIAALLALSPRRPTALQMMLFLGFAALSLKTSRGIVWFGLVMAPVIADHAAAVGSRWFRASSASSAPAAARLNLAMLGLLLGMGVVSLPWFKSILPLTQAKAGVISFETPIAATEWLLENQPPQNIFHTMHYGSYLIWAAQPDYPVFVDSRIELYSPQVWQDYIWVSNTFNPSEGGWEAILDRYGVQTLMLSRVEHAGLIAAATASPAWTQVYTDAETVILTHR